MVEGVPKMTKRKSIGLLRCCFALKHMKQYESPLRSWHSTPRLEIGDYSASFARCYSVPTLEALNFQSSSCRGHPKTMVFPKTSCPSNQNLSIFSQRQILSKFQSISTSWFWRSSSPASSRTLPWSREVSTRHPLPTGLPLEREWSLSYIPPLQHPPPERPRSSQKFWGLSQTIA